MEGRCEGGEVWWKDSVVWDGGGEWGEGGGEEDCVV